MVLFGLPVAKQVLGGKTALNKMEHNIYKFREVPAYVSKHPSSIWALRNQGVITGYVSKVAKFLKD